VSDTVGNLSALIGFKIRHGQGPDTWKHGSGPSPVDKFKKKESIWPSPLFSRSLSFSRSRSLFSLLFLVLSQQWRGAGRRGRQGQRQVRRGRRQRQGCDEDDDSDEQDNEARQQQGICSWRVSIFISLFSLASCILGFKKFIIWGNVMNSRLFHDNVLNLIL